MSDKKNKSNYVRKFSERYTHQRIIQYSIKKIKTKKTTVTGRTMNWTEYIEGDLIREWKGAGEINRELGYDKSSILRCCKREQQKAYWFIWRYKKDVETENSET